jgi:hypothetical protein
VPLRPLGSFLEAVEPHILADRLPCPGPELVHALVDHFAAPAGVGGTSSEDTCAGGGAAQLAQTHRVERCVLHLDVFHLDLDQVRGGL